MKKNLSVTGSCLCGEVSFSISELDRDVVVCHCQQCRKQTGHVVAATRVSDKALKTTGEQHIHWYAASESAKRGFCRHCGSLLFWKSNDSEHTSVMAGSLDSPTGLETVAHIFTEFKGDYYKLNDDLPQHLRSD